jgi:hypothetical protein
MAGSGPNTTGGIDAWVRRARRNGRTPAAVMAAFLAGILVAALFIPNHARPGSTTQGALGVAGSSAASGSTAPGQSTTTTDGSAPSTASNSASGPFGVKGVTTAGGVTGAHRGTSTPGVTTAGAASAANSGASAQGVTATSIKLGVLGGSSATVGSACPRCNNGGQATDQAMVNGLIALWHKQGKLPVDGRNIVPVFASANDLDATGVTVQSACEQLGGQAPFVALTGFSIGGDDCLGQTYHVFAFDSSAGASLGSHSKSYPYFWEVGPSLEQSLTSWASWANAEGLLKGHVLGLYAPNDQADSGFQELLSATFRARLQQLGYHLAVDYAYGQNSSSDDPIAVQKMKAAGVNVVFVFGSLTEPSGFQNDAQQLGYSPTYPTVDAGDGAFADSLADVAYNGNAENGSLGLGSRWWDWSSRNPATPADNPAAADCVNAYEQQTGTTLDVYSNDAVLRYILDECSDMQVILQGLENAGPDLTSQTFIHGMEQVQNMQTGEYESVSFTNGPGTEGDNDWQTVQFNQNRWQPSNDLWGVTGPYGNWSEFPGDAATVAAAIKAGV